MLVCVGEEGGVYGNIANMSLSSSIDGIGVVLPLSEPKPVSEPTSR